MSTASPNPHAPEPGEVGEVTRLLAAAPGAPVGQDPERLLALVYEELRRLADRAMAREPAGLTLQPTALVHEAWMQLVGEADRSWQNRTHFFRTAARSMRRILIDRARRVAQPKHGGGRLRVTLDRVETASLPQPASTYDALALDEALAGLEEVDPRMAEIVSLRFFAGLSVEETGRALDISPRTVKREWNVARAWLSERLREVS